MGAIRLFRHVTLRRPFAWECLDWIFSCSVPLSNRNSLCTVCDGLNRMLGLVVENASFEDGLYYLDRGFTDGVIALPDFLAQVRKLSRKQFIARATIKKVRATLAVCNIFIVLGRAERLIG